MKINRFSISTYIGALRDILSTFGPIKFITLQSLGILSGLLASFSIALFFPIILTVLSGEDAAIQKVSGISELANIQITSGNLLFYLVIFISVSFFLRLCFYVSYSALSGFWLEKNAAIKRLNMLYVYHNTYGNKDSHTDRSKIIHLNNQLINFNSFNWALLDLLIHLYTIFFYIFLIVYAYQNYLVNILAAIFLISILIVPVIKVASKAGSIFISTQGRLIKSISRIIDGIETIITFGSIDSITRKVKDDNKIVIKNGLFLSGSVSLSSLFPEFIIVILICLMLLVYTVPVEGIATLATFSIIGLRMLQTINQISSCLGRAEASKEAYLEIINFFQSKAINHSHSNLGKRDFKESFYKLELRNIEVVIGKNKILSDVSYNFQQKRKYIISGANGSGKSTLIKTLVGLVDAQGNFLINDQDISSYSAASLQKLITFHNQDNFLFEGTVLENISFFSSVDISKVQEVFAELTIEPSKVFSNGLNTTIKENGIGMSGGQKQLICLARSLTTNAQILVLDEPTNHLSKENAKKIMSYLLGLDKTVIIVSHEIFSEEVKNISYLNTGKIKVSEINN